MCIMAIAGNIDSQIFGELFLVAASILILVKITNLPKLVPRQYFHYSIVQECTVIIIWYRI